MAQIDAFLRESGLTPSQFGRRAVNDPNLVGDLRGGREPRPVMVRRIRAFIAAQAAR